MPCDETQLKKVEFYSACVNAWINTQLERDKSLLTLSASGIGLLITLLTTVGVSSVKGLLLYLPAFLCFLICVVCVLAIFKQNGKYIEKMLGKGEETLSVGQTLQRLDSIAIYSFAFGVVFAVLVGVSAAITHFVNKEKSMANENKSSSEKMVLGKNFNVTSNLQYSQGVSIASESLLGLEIFDPQQVSSKISIDAQILQPSAPASSGSEGGPQQVQTIQSSTSQQGGDKK